MFAFFEKSTVQSLLLLQLLLEKTDSFQKSFPLLLPLFFLGLKGLSACFSVAIVALHINIIAPPKKYSSICDRKLHTSIKYLPQNKFNLFSSKMGIFLLPVCYSNKIEVMKSRGQRITEKVQKSTADEEQKVHMEKIQRYVLFKKLQSQSAEQFRDIDIDQFDLNITQHVEEAEQIDSAITPLIFASFFGLKEISKTLLRNQRVDVDLETENNGQTPLLTACICGNYEIARLLLLANAEPNKPNYLNQSPLACTLFRLVEEPASFQNKKICFLIAELLIRHGADPNWIIDKKQGLSLLHYFCNIKMKMNKSQKQLNYDIIKFLLDKGADSRQLTLSDNSCEELLKTHCNKEELLRLLQSYRSKEPVPVPGVQLKPIKKIDANFFSIPKK